MALRWRTLPFAPSFAPCALFVISDFGGPEVLRVTPPGPTPCRAPARSWCAWRRRESTGRTCSSDGGSARRRPASRKGRGWSFAGAVHALGPGAARWRLGRHVKGIGAGSEAVHAAEPARATARPAHHGTVAGGGYAKRWSSTRPWPWRRPRGWTRCGPGNPGGLHDRVRRRVFCQAGLTPGETLLIHAVGSGVGTAALQLARRAGVRSPSPQRAKSSPILTAFVQLGLRARRCRPLGTKPSRRRRAHEARTRSSTRWEDRPRVAPATRQLSRASASNGFVPTCTTIGSAGGSSWPNSATSGRTWLQANPTPAAARCRGSLGQASSRVGPAAPRPSRTR